MGRMLNPNHETNEDVIVILNKSQTQYLHQTIITIFRAKL